MPQIHGIDLDMQHAYADGVRCPGAGTFHAPQPHANASRLAYSGSSLWSCTTCARSFVSSDVAKEQQRVREINEGECAAY